MCLQKFLWYFLYLCWDEPAIQALTPHKYQKSHSESKFPIFINMFFLLDAPHFGV